jgi:hypothetical protein
LKDDGIIIAQTGTSPRSGSEYVASDYYRETFPNIWDFASSRVLDENFEKIIEYSEFVKDECVQKSRCLPRRFFICMKDKSLVSNRAATEAEISLLIQKSTKKYPDFLHFDAAMMKNYQIPSRIAEDADCKDSPDSIDFYGKHGYDPFVQNFPLKSSFEVRHSTVKNGGRGVYATKYIPRGSYLGLEEIVQGMLILPSTLHLLEIFSDEFDGKIDYFKLLFWGYVHGYGWYEEIYVSRLFPPCSLDCHFSMHFKVYY